jgi:RNA polymerase sigma-70 factor (ECF subfamily)
MAQSSGADTKSAARRDLARFSDVDLIRLCVGGERPVFAELVRRHSGALRTCLRRMGASAHDADDMAQEALIVAYERLEDYRFDGPFAAWLKRIAARRYLKRVRGDKRYMLTDDPAAYEADAPQDDGFRAHNLDAALNRLKPVERLCVCLSFAGDLSHRDIADELKLPLGTVKSHLKRAMERLKAILAPSETLVETPARESAT